MNTGKTSYQEAITTLGITQDRFRYLLKTFGERIKSISQGKERFIVAPGIQLLMEAVAIINTGVSPRDAVAQVAAKDQPAVVALVPKEEEKKDSRFEGMEKALLMMAEEVKASRQEMLSLRSEVAFLRNQLAPPSQNLLPVIPWKPIPKPDPLAGVNYFKRFWVKMFHPEQLRRWED